MASRVHDSTQLLLFCTPPFSCVVIASTTFSKISVTDWNHTKTNAHIVLADKQGTHLYLPWRDQGPVSWRLTTVKWRRFSQSNCRSTIGTQQTEYHEALPSSVKDVVRYDRAFDDDGNASWYSVCWVPMVEWPLDKTVITLRPLASMIPAPVLTIYYTVMATALDKTLKISNVFYHATHLHPPS